MHDRFRRYVSRLPYPKNRTVCEGGSVGNANRPRSAPVSTPALPPALFLVPLDDAVILGLLRRRGGLLLALEFAAALEAEPATGSIVVRSPPRCDRRGLLNRQLPMRLPSPFQGAFRASGSGPPFTAGKRQPQSITRRRTEWPTWLRPIVQRGSFAEHASAVASALALRSP